MRNNRIGVLSDDDSGDDFQFDSDIEDETVRHPFHTDHS